MKKPWHKPRFFYYSISKASLTCLFGRTRESKIPIIAGANHGREASANGRAFTIFARKSILNVDPNTLADTYVQLDKDQLYYVICKSGMRSARACQFLAEQGYEVINVQGGMDALE